MFSLFSPRRGASRTAVVGAVAGAAVLTAAVAGAATGDLDPSWSTDGIHAQTGGATIALATTAQADGRLIVAGTGSVPDGTPSNSGTYVSRYTIAGALDQTYGVNGVVKLSIAPGTEVVRDIVVDANGRAIIAGYVAAPDYPDETDLFVLRLTAAGGLDTTFGGGDGIVTIDKTNHDRGTALAIRGKQILLGAGLDSGGNWGLQWTVFALTGAGAIDATFSGDGMAAVPTTKVGSFDSLRDLAVAPDGKILLGGSSGNDFASARLTKAGALDKTYDADGVARTLVDGGGTGFAMLLQPDNKVVVTGYAAATGRSDSDFAAVRWTSAGQLDTSFGGDGKVVVDLGDQRNNRAQGAALAADSKIVLAGFADPSTGSDSAIARLDWDGTLDTSFSGDGLATLSTLATANEQLEAVTVVGGDKIRAVGSNLEGWTLLGYTGGANYTLSVNDVAVTEPDSGTTTASFVVTLASSNPQPVTVRYATASGTASAPGDFTGTSGTLTFPAGTTSRTVTVPVVGDTVVEGDETFSVKLSLPTNAGISDAVGTGTIRNED